MKLTNSHYIRYLITIIILIFSFQSLTKADDIRDFQIEGMSIGDSLLDYFSEDEINSNLNYNSYTWKSKKKFIDLEFYSKKKFKMYDGAQITVKKGDKKYLIHAIAGGKFYDGTIDVCYFDMKNIRNEIKDLFTNAKTEFDKKLDHPNGKGFALSNWFDIDGGSISLMCTDWNNDAEKNLKWKDNLRIEVRNNEFSEWIDSN